MYETKFGYLAPVVVVVVTCVMGCEWQWRAHVDWWCLELVVRSWFGLKIHEVTRLWRGNAELHRGRCSSGVTWETKWRSVWWEVNGCTVLHVTVQTRHWGVVLLWNLVIGTVHCFRWTESFVIYPLKAHWSLYVPHSGHYMHHQFNIQQFYVLPTHCIYVFCVDLRTNSDYFPIQH